jgi:putative sugar O-methyltransferase
MLRVRAATASVMADNRMLRRQKEWTEMSERSGPVLSQPSRFWEELGAQHARDLTQHGFGEVKRRQALKYFNWRWTFGHMPRSEQMRFLLRHNNPITWATAALGRADLSDAAWRGVDWSPATRRLYVAAIRLLWEYARRHDAAGVLRLPEPELGGPLPVHWRGRLISQDLANSALELGAIYPYLSAAPRSVLEVGAGYGRTAYAVLSLFRDAAYTIVDVEPALSISRWYVEQLFPDRDVRFVSPADVSRLVDGSFDLVLSISTLHEMTPEQASGYLQLFDRVAAGGAVYLKQWDEWLNPVDEVTMRFDGYPFPARWQQLFREAAPVQTRFKHGGWRIPR